MATFSCKEETFQCTCDTSNVAENDSIIKNARLDSSIIKLDKRYNQELLEKRCKESYRVYIRHSLNKYFQVYTLVKNNNDAALEIQEYKGSSGFSLDNSLDTSFTIKITNKQWTNIKKSIDSNCFWTLRFNDADRHETLDGGEMILEGYQPSKSNCANTDFFLIVDWVSKDKRIYKIIHEIRKYAKEEELHVYNALQVQKSKP